VLSTVLERYLFISMRLFGLSWLYWPGVLVMIAIVVFSLYYGFKRPKPKPAAALEGQEAAVAKDV
jgi:hypothetical protein